MTRPFWELKHDGFRALAYIEDGTCRLISRKNIVYKSFAGLSEAVAGLRVKNAMVGNASRWKTRFQASRAVAIWKTRVRDSSVRRFEHWMAKFEAHRTSKLQTVVARGFSERGVRLGPACYHQRGQPDDFVHRGVFQEPARNASGPVAF